jgi:hypothetical protein
MEGVPTRVLPVQITMLDEEEKKFAEISTSYPPWLLTVERVQEVVPVEGQIRMCEYRSWVSKSFSDHKMIRTKIFIIANCRGSRSILSSPNGERGPGR